MMGTQGARWNAFELMLALVAAAVMGAAPAGRGVDQAPPQGGRTVAVTFDDLPATRSGSLADMQAITRDLLSHFRTNAIHVTGFVNENKLEAPGEEEARTALLQAWLDAGHDLGNQLSRRLFGHEPAQVLLLHANALNAEYFDDLFAMMRARGYRVVTLDHALADEAYRSPDAYVGDRGFSWLQRWAITRGENPGLQPEVPEWVRTMARG